MQNKIIRIRIIRYSGSFGLFSQHGCKFVHRRASNCQEQETISIDHFIKKRFLLDICKIS